jgi:hypothetical protein
MSGIGYIELAKPQPVQGIDPDLAVELWVSADQVWALDMDEHNGWDWIADGYCVIRTSPGKHDGHDATVMTLADSDTQREVGRLVLRNDALRDARLLVTRQFETKQERDAFVRSLELGGTDEVKTIQLDVAEQDLLEALLEMTEGTTISYRVVKLHGPGGGWPVVAFTGKDRELRRMLVDHYGAGDGSGESVAFYMGEED